MKKLMGVIAGLALGVAGLGAGVALVPTSTAAAAEKVFVCKYVGTPGVDEELQSGQNPISVSVNALPPGFTGTFPFEFEDAQGRSVAIAFDVGQPEPPVTDCPGAVGPPRGVGTAAAICDPAQNLYIVSGEIDGVPGTVTPTTIPGDKVGPTLVTVTVGAVSQQIIVTTDGTCVDAPPPTTTEPPTTTAPPPTTTEPPPTTTAPPTTTTQPPPSTTEPPPPVTTSPQPPPAAETTPPATTTEPTPTTTETTSSTPPVSSTPKAPRNPAKPAEPKGTPPKKQPGKPCPPGTTEWQGRCSANVQGNG